MRLTNVMVIPPSLPFKTVADFIAYGKANPGKLSFASSGNGTSVHMSGELFKTMAGIDMVHVPYRGSAGAIPTATAKVHVLFDNLPPDRTFATAKGGPRRPSRRAGPRCRTATTLKPDYEASVWYGLSAPKGTPADVVAILNKSVTAGLADPKAKAKLAELGGIPMPMSPAEFGKLVADETEKWAKVVKFANISVE
jgi:tripartite-type tricarboxylate transporter receptor subunit TctC